MEMKSLKVNDGSTKVWDIKKLVMVKLRTQTLIYEVFAEKELEVILSNVWCVEVFEQQHEFRFDVLESTNVKVWCLTYLRYLLVKQYLGIQVNADKLFIDDWYLIEEPAIQIDLDWKKQRLWL